MQPEQVALFATEFVAEWNRLQAEASGNWAAGERALQAVRRKLAGLIDAIADGLRAPSLQTQLDELETRKAALERDLATVPAAAPALHPNLAELYRQKVTDLQAALQDANGVEALEAARALIDRVVLHPAAEGNGHEIELVGEIAAMVELAIGHGRGGASAGQDRGLFVRSVKVVAGAGFEPAAFRL